MHRRVVMQHVIALAVLIDDYADARKADLVDPAEQVKIVPRALEEVLHEMEMRVDKTGKHRRARGVDLLPGAVAL